jgi:hypothetical protein
MTPARIAGVVLIVIGLIGVLYGGISWTKEKTVIDVGPLKAQTEEHKMIPIPPVVGGIALVAGIVLLVLPARKRG